MTGLEPLAGGFSGETFTADVAGERVVVRIYAGRSASRGPGAADRDAAILRWAGNLLPVPEPLEIRRGTDEVPPVLVTSYLPGERLDQILPTLDESDRAAVGAAVGRVLGRLAGVVLPRAGEFRDDRLTIEPFQGAATDLEEWADAHAESLRLVTDFDGLSAVAATGQRILDEAGSAAVLVHSDLNPKNLLVDPATCAVTGVLDWEFAHAGSAYADLGNVIRFDRSSAYVEAVIAARTELAPADPADRQTILDRARAADLFALVDLAVRAGREPRNTAAQRARVLLEAIAATRDLHAWPD